MKSLRVRLLLALLGMLAVAALVMGGVTYRTVLAQAESLFDYQLRQMALSLRDQGEIDGSQASALADGQLDFVVQIWTVDGRGIYASRNHSSLPERALLGFADLTVGGQTWRTFGVATRDRVIQVAQPLQTRRRLAADAALRSVSPLALVAPVLAVAIWWLAALTVQPLRRVAAEVRARDEQSLQPLKIDDLPDEVTPLVRALNGLLQRLGTSFDAQRAFVADAAHELRSPLTALKLQIQLLRRAPDEASRAAATDALAAGIERAVRGVEQLLSLARSEPGAPLALQDGVDLVEIAREALAATAPFAHARGTALALVAPEPVRLRAEPAALVALVRNLADNAVRYSPPGSRVELRVDAEGGAPRLVVDDAGPGIAPADRERVFDRFHRQAAGDEPGTGLGLAIVRGIAERHGAVVVLGDSPLGGLRVSVRFAPPASRTA